MEKKDINIVKPPNLFKQTQGKIKEIEGILGGTFLVYWSAGNGTITHSDVPPLAEVLKHIGKHEEIYLFIKSNEMVSRRCGWSTSCASTANG